MAKVIVQHVCSECGTTTGRWLGKCPGCGAFGSLVEELSGQASPSKGKGGIARSPARLADVRSEEAARISTGVPELDRVLGGGIVPASLVLVGGEPGVGKSTLLLMVLGAVANQCGPGQVRRRALLVTGEESAAQVKLRAERIGGTDSVEILAETELDVICATLERDRPDVCVIDSIQTLHSADLSSAPGSVAQVREAAGRLLRVAKEQGVATILVGHVTKDGAVAGPRVLEHLVDCVLQFEGDRHNAHRVLRASKNRFGSTNEIAVFEMTAAGLVGVPDPSAIFGRSVGGEVGAAVACTLEGTRPLLIEVQALVARSDLAMPRRVGTGVDPKRLAMIVAVLGRHGGIPLGAADVFVNVAGGVRIDEPGADLAVALAIASAARGVPLREGVASFGEIGLTGRLRVAGQAERRLQECARFGVLAAIVPEGTQAGIDPAVIGLRVDRAETVRRGIGVALDAGRTRETEGGAPEGVGQVQVQVRGVGEGALSLSGAGAGRDEE
jgi:DNA repair protein RadA/Sms